MAPRIAFAGSGSIGSVVGGLLTKAGHDVTLLDGWREHVDAMNRNGLKLSGTVGEHTVPVKAVHFDDLGSVSDLFDIVFVAVKSYDTERAAGLTLPLTRPDTRFVSLQNCMNDERLHQTVGGNRTLGCVTTISTGLYEPGRAQRTDALDSGTFKVGEMDGSDTPRAREIVEVLADAGIAYLTTELFAERWAKLAGNASTNALVGITGYGTVETLLDPRCRKIAIHAAAETVRVANAIGQHVPDVMGIPAQAYVAAVDSGDLSDVEKGIHAYTKKTKNTGIASLGQDVMKGRKTEIDYINGHVSHRGREVGVATPVCDALVEIFHRAPSQIPRQDPAQIDDLYGSLP